MRTCKSRYYKNTGKKSKSCLQHWKVINWSTKLNKQTMRLNGYQIANQKTARTWKHQNVLYYMKKE